MRRAVAVLAGTRGRAALLVFCVLLSGCLEEGRDELFRKGQAAMEQENVTAAVVYYKSSLEKDPGFAEARHALALAYKRLGKFDKAAAEFGKLVTDGQADVAARLEHVRLLLASSQLADAEGRADDLLHVSGDAAVQSEALYLRGTIRLTRKALGAAEKDFLEAVDRDASNGPALVELARLALARGQRAEARQRIAAAIAARPAEGGSYLMLANVELDAGDVDAALRALDKAVELNPDDRMAMYRKAVLLVDRQDVDGLAKVAEQLRQRFPKSAEAGRVQGMLQYFRNQDVDALALLGKAQEQQPTAEGYYFMGLAYSRRGEQETALSMLRKVIELVPDYIPARLHMSRIHLLQRRLAQAVEEAREAVKITPRGAEARAALATALVGNGQVAEGLQEYAKALELDGSMQDVRIQKALVELEAGRSADAERTLLQVVAADPGNLRNRMLLFAQYLREGKWDKARTLLQQALRNGPQDAPLHNSLSLAALRSGDSRLALEELDKAKAADPAYVGTYFAKARLLAALREQDKAEAELRALLAMEPGNPEALYQLAGLQLLRKQDAAAWETMAQAVKSARPEMLPEIAQAYMGAGNTAGALAVADELAARGDATQGRLLKVRLLVQAGDHDGALKLLDELGASQPEVAGAARVEVLLQRRDFPAAEQEARRLLLASPESAEGHVRLARVHAAGARPDLAADALEKGLAKEPGDPQSLLLLGDVWSAAGRLDTAAQAYERLLKARPELPQGHFSMGVLQEARGRPEEAKAFYLKALERDGRFVPALNNLSYLLAQEAGQEKAALVLALQAHAQQPRDPAVMDSLGFALLQNGRGADAVPLLAQAAQSGNPTILYHLALAHAQAGDRQAAKAALRQALERGEFREAALARKLIEHLSKSS